MAHSTYEPPTLEIILTLGLGLTVLSPYYRGFARGLVLREPQGHGLTLDELDRLMTAAGLRPTETKMHRAALVAVCDATYTS